MSLHAEVRATAGTFTIDVAFEVAEGQTVAVLGPNGAGKSTLLRGLCGLLRLDAGRLALNGRVFDEPATGTFVPPECRPVGVVFQDLRLVPHLSAVENVAFGLRCRGVPRADARRSAAAWLERFGLGGRAGARPRELSGGQAQRVALARALAVAPELLLLDEPLSALDVGLRADMRRDLQQALASFPGVRLVVTHDPTEAFTLADRLVIIEDGRIVQSGSPAEVTARPRSPYVARFVGVNLLRGWADGDRLTVEGGRELIVPKGAVGDVWAGIHPRAVALHRERPDGTPRNAWRCRIESLDVERDVLRVSLAGKPSVVAEVTAAAFAELGLEPGDEVWASVKATEIEVFAA
ncbi:sulfate/molybdate ABC transporter ATP-binding protein [Streptomyces coeruleoprunus]|uniref:Sulfate/molybdate ABC transporter ATP-binding protein n=1 Tax=Streptomyces coeruleoprunus TaxID=285563 RepID=A0ABV9XBN9_9ACTN